MAELSHKLHVIFKDPKKILAMGWRRASKLIKSDKKYLSVYYYLKMGQKLNITKPITFQEKLQWLKLNDRNPSYSQMADKYEVRKIIEKKIGEEYLIPLLGVWENFNEIDFEILPEQFVLKTTHDSGSIVVVKNKNKFLNSRALKKANDKLSVALKYNYFYAGREYQYKNLKPRIIAEKFMQDTKQNDLLDYKFFCFSGVPRLVFIASDRFKGGIPKFDFYDMDFNKMPFIAKGHPQAAYIKKPDNFDQMVSIASKLSQGIPHVRIDLYSINGNIYFGEFTFFHDGGFVPFVPEKWNKILGEWIELPSKRN
jgi:hypothetical protein